MRLLRLNKEIEIFIAGIGAAQSLLMALYSFFEPKKDYRNLLLFVFFFAITVRLTKSILWVYLDTSPLWMLNLGFIAHSISGPALFLYMLHFIYTRKWSAWNLLHFLPSIILLFYVSSLSLDGFWHKGGYSVLLFHQVSYTLASLFLLGKWLLPKNRTEQKQHVSLIWIVSLVLGTAVLQFLYFSNYILGITPYLLGPISYLPFVYFMAFLLFKNPSLLKNTASKKSQNIRLTQHELNIYASKLEEIMYAQKLYLDTNCALDTIAKQAKLPAYMVSYVLNNAVGKSFPDFLNSYRIEEVKMKLVHPDHKHTKIASIAYDCGFNTLSSFNIAFKKTTGITPTQFQKRHNVE
ncbi:helix-turn-helix domain-containing protein [Flagellimonas pacifica]|uniref:AraC-type DNA-binding protein n=1 Tax=Flagellimonas pacifica TaxID=1247520 RepID=A0A285MSF7_9FLAO|nr:AraC family transcriptional regulator [Allomuricauda parva]SNZ00124.1 AraC-type DNA-binding protein [Allomuricauda parva]